MRFIVYVSVIEKERGFHVLCVLSSIDVLLEKCMLCLSNDSFERMELGAAESCSSGVENGFADSPIDYEACAGDSEVAFFGFGLALPFDISHPHDEEDKRGAESSTLFDGEFGTSQF
jgi:hypothetical protein